MQEDDVTKSSSRSGEDVIREFLPTSPFVGHLGLRLAELRPDFAVLVLPFAPEVVTIASVVHGGAIASLIDTAATVAAWSGVEPPVTFRGATVGMTVSYLAPAESTDLHASARVLRRGRSIVYLDVDVLSSSGQLVAKGLVTYKIG
jgi:uncharacterized protein (TIGR00369 family)